MSTIAHDHKAADRLDAIVNRLDAILDDVDDILGEITPIEPGFYRMEDYEGFESKVRLLMKEASEAGMGERDLLDSLRRITSEYVGEVDLSILSDIELARRYHGKFLSAAHGYEKEHAADLAAMEAEESRRDINLTALVEAERDRLHREWCSRPQYAKALEAFLQQRAAAKPVSPTL